MDLTDLLAATKDVNAAITQIDQKLRKPEPSSTQAPPVTEQATTDDAEELGDVAHVSSNGYSRHYRCLAVARPSNSVELVDLDSGASTVLMEAPAAAAVADLREAIEIAATAGIDSGDEADAAFTALAAAERIAALAAAGEASMGARAAAQAGAQQWRNERKIAALTAAGATRVGSHERLASRASRASSILPPPMSPAHAAGRATASVAFAAYPPPKPPPPPPPPA